MAVVEPVSFISDGTFDLNDLATELLSKWNVDHSLRLSVQATLVSGAWANASVIVRGSIDETNWKVFHTFTGVGFKEDLDIAPYRFVDVKVSVVETTAGVARFRAYAITPPFDWRGPVEAEMTFLALGTEQAI